MRIHSSMIAAVFVTGFVMMLFTGLLRSEEGFAAGSELMCSISVVGASNEGHFVLESERAKKIHALKKEDDLEGYYLKLCEACKDQIRDRKWIAGVVGDYNPIGGSKAVKITLENLHEYKLRIGAHDGLKSIPCSNFSGDYEFSVSKPYMNNLKEKRLEEIPTRTRRRRNESPSSSRQAD